MEREHSIVAASRSPPLHKTALIVLALAFGTPAIAGALRSEPVTIAGGAGSAVSIAQWKIQASAKAQQGGAVISRPGFPTGDWYTVGANSTVMAGLLANGKYPDVFHGPNLRAVQVPDADGHWFETSWWYRTAFQIPASPAGLRTIIRTNGIIPMGDLWLNGKEIAGHQEIAGAYTTHEIDVTALVHAGSNVLAIRVYPGSPQRDLSLGWIDWNPAPPDNNMGIWREVEILRTGPVSLHDLHVVSQLALPERDHASVAIKVELHNDSSSAEDAVVSGSVAGIALRRNVRMAPHTSTRITFDPRNDPSLELDHPKVWWPAGWGAQPLYHVTLTASVDGVVSDRAQTTFGIRDVSSHLTPQGYRQFVINGIPLLIRGAGWSPDMFLRDQPERLATEFRYIRNLGLNAIRTEGKLERADFYRLADREGILILAGWECCDKWEAWAGTGGEPWSPADLATARASMASEARRLRDHPSVIAFLIGSDNAPPPEIAKAYVDSLRAADWPGAVISAASAQKTEAAGPSGMKMSGPYAWVPPDYWYAERDGGAFGFNSETSAGIDIPRLSSLRKMLTPQERDALWRDSDVRQFHAAPFWSPFSSLKSFDTALAHRYGAPKSLGDYVEKAQLMNYEAVRAQFEAYNARMDAAKPSTGVIYWMLTNGWPSLHWHLFGYDLDPAGAYFGAQKANERVHIQYAYDDRAIMAINHSLEPMHNLSARIRVRDLDGSVRYERTLEGIELPAHHAKQLAVVPALPHLPTTYFVELELNASDGRGISRNVYWLATQPDRLDWSKTNWYMTPVTRYADLGVLEGLPPADVHARIESRRDGSGAATTVTLTAAPNSPAVALFVHVSLRQADGKPILPVTWTHNDVTLWPGESATLVADSPVIGNRGPVVQLSGWNVNPQTHPVGTLRDARQ